MKTKVIPSGWLQIGGRRLDSGPYLLGALEARLQVERTRARKDRLQDVTFGKMEGIFHAGRESRRWVTDPAHGVPFMSSTDILATDLSTLPLLAKKQVTAMPKFVVREGWTLITRSGTIGRMAYARPEMDGLACSEHVIRVIPDREKIASGYLFAYLSSKLGFPLVVSGTYGSIIQSIEPQHIADLPVPRFGPDIEQCAHRLVLEAAAHRTLAAERLREVSRLLFLELGLPDVKHKYDRPLWHSVNVALLQRRSDAFYFGAPNQDARVAFDSANVCSSRELGAVADVFIPGIFKRRYAEDPRFGHPYITGADVFQLAPTSSQFLLNSVASEYNLVLRKGMILIQEAGQLGGLIGRSVCVGAYLDGFACTNNMVRIVPNNELDGGYLYAVLSSKYGVRLIAREAAGSSIPHIEVGRMRSLQIPWAAEEVRHQIGRIVLEARNLRDGACEKEQAARTLVEQAIERG
jgi:type I restriction enzyme, S subunit